MITYTFILKDPNGQTSPVFLAIRDNGRRLKISTGLTVQTDTWDKDNFQMTRKSPFHKTENAVLLRWKNAAETAVRETFIFSASSLFPPCGISILLALIYSSYIYSVFPFRKTMQR